MTNSVLMYAFRHRENLDGTWDSICLCCYATAAHSHEQASLGVVESRHRCDKTSWLYKEPMGAPMLRTDQQFTRHLSVMRGGRPAGLREQHDSQANS